MMGIHITLHDCETFQRHPEWRWIRVAGDDEMAAVMYELPWEFPWEGTNPEDPWEKGLLRPTDFNAWREAVEKFPARYRKRFKQLVDLLERDTNYGLCAWW